MPCRASCSTKILFGVCCTHELAARALFSNRSGCAPAPCSRVSVPAGFPQKNDAPKSSSPPFPGVSFRGKPHWGWQIARAGRARHSDWRPHPRHCKFHIKLLTWTTHMYIVESTCCSLLFGGFPTTKRSTPGHPILFLPGRLGNWECVCVGKSWATMVHPTMADQTGFAVVRQDSVPLSSFTWFPCHQHDAPKDVRYGPRLFACQMNLQETMVKSFKGLHGLKSN